MVKELEAFYLRRFALLQSFAGELDFSQVDPTDVHEKNLDEKNCNPIVIVGEAPGANEVEAGVPFVGMAGKNLTFSIHEAGLDRQRDFLVTNAFPFRTFEKGSSGVKNRTPSTGELKKGATLLKMELEIIRPKMILLLGGSAKKAFLKIDDKKTTQEVKTMENHSFRRIETGMGFETIIGLSFHPSPLVFNMKHKRERLLRFFTEIKEYLL